MHRRSISLCLAIAALAGLSAPGAAAPATAATAKAPTITRVTPMRLRVGSTVVIRGRNFSSRRTRNTVIFRTPNGRSAFIKPSRATTRKLVVKIPRSMARLLTPQSSRFKLRVLTGRKFSKWTPRRLSPVFVGTGTPPRPVGVAPGSGPGAAAAGCGTNFDDGDLLSASFESTIKTDPCVADSDGDGAGDGYEYQSALDLNYYPGSAPLPYPGKRPYPNPLDPSDANTDYDGDGLTVREEHLLWQRFSSDGVPRGGAPTTLASLVYSDGLQSSRSVAAPAAGTLANWALDQDGNGMLSDDERDGDGDGLANWDEARGKFTEEWLTKFRDGENAPKESKYPDINFLDNADLPNRDGLADSDIDGDGVLDGSDDHDNDGLTNQFEVRRPDDWFNDAIVGFPTASNPWAYTNPFNPCKPFNSARCHRHPPTGYYAEDDVPPIGPNPPGGYPDTHPTTPDG